ncbi:hypothetical protein A2871_02135 [Candidatus Daviesbacteria bacterium RIFCSPHIGHO2_01_FULL_41_23]|uniref:Homing endonuclease LAGLIDADG domain-containing protein n=1 Tax=Candidatus Daviesbacteria bacterium RIFCSPHIGHO2_01_FULL_41_23 TaxID=1797764 RepID=A0A1F5IRF5_9BACT|nr:MAG: hypothetical protein A2871_02135 [Candidatus Daviesbacteria bacterium RIFCSPHIGHO2_01_FULL_41_23]
MDKIQKAVAVGAILGDGFLQKTGKNNARLRLEHSLKQQDYLIWKCKILSNFFQKKPEILTRNNLKFGKSYQYIRNQSYSGSEFGKLHQLFYVDGKKVIPDKISKLLKESVSLAVWFMDDGYYYPRDKIAYIYLPKLDSNSIKNLLIALKINYGLSPRLKIKKRGEYVLIFTVKETLKLIHIIKPYIIKSMSYKLPFDPVSTDPSSKQ